MVFGTAAEGHRVLIIAPFGRDAEQLSELFAGHGYDAQVCAGLHALVAGFDEHIGAVLLTEEALVGDLEPLRAALAAQPAWSEVPFLLLSARKVGSSRGADAARLRLPDISTNVILLERPLGSESLLSAVASAMRSRQRQFEMRDRIAELAAGGHALANERHALEILNRTGTRIAAELDLERLVQAVVDNGVELIDAEMGAFFYNTSAGDGHAYKLFALSGADRATFEFDTPRITPLFAPTFRGQGVVRSADVALDHRYGQQAPHYGLPHGHPPVRSYIAVSVISRSGEVMGALMFGHVRPEVFDDRAERLISGLAAQAAVGIDNARLFQSAQRMNQTLEDKVAERTAELQAEMERRARTEAALRQSQKMEAVGQLTGGIAHDFNNMLTGIIGALDIMKRRIASDRLEDIDRFMQAASTSALRAAGLTERLLAFSRRQSLDPKPTDINQLIGSLEDLARRTIGKGVVLSLDLHEARPIGVVDANQLENALLNLVINGRDAMPEGGRLTIESGITVIEDAAVAAAQEIRPGRYAVVAVSDTGVGMSPEVIDKAFEPFFTTKPMGQGTGLGLSMVYGFVRQSNGQVRIHSRPGEGTSVKLYLPAAEPAAAGAEVASSAVISEGQGQAVLIVEDDESVRLIVREVLEELGYVAIDRADAQTAIPLLASDQPLDLMISDVGLPGMNGRQLAEVARQHRPKLPILFVTGYAENAAIRAGFLGTDMAMISKPFAIPTLAAKIIEILETGGKIHAACGAPAKVPESKV